jgi:hypothetical protein
VVDKKRNVLWVSDEYGPFIVKIDPATGIILNKYAPGSGLPDIFPSAAPTAAWKAWRWTPAPTSCTVSCKAR